MSGKDEGGQAQCIAILIAAILTMLAELTFILLAVCWSTQSGADHTNEDIRALLTTGDVSPFKTSVVGPRVRRSSIG